MILPNQHLLDITMGKMPMITSANGINKEQVQMVTVDCSLAKQVYRVNAAALPSKGETVEELINKFSSYDFSIQESGSVLEKGACYIIPLNEAMAFAKQFSTIFSPKSSIGRTDTFVRVLIDYNPQYDRTDPGYVGALYLEIMPLSFNVKVTPSLEMTQFRVREGDQLLSDEDLMRLHSRHGVLHSKEGEVLSLDDVEVFERGYFFHIDLDRDIVGFEAKANPTANLDLSKKDHYNIDDFWIPIGRPKNGEIVLTPGRFYLLTTKERVKIPKECCAEVVPYDVSSGEFRTHYAGFFDNNFGAEGGTHVVLEVRARDVPHRLYDGQRVCRMVFEETIEIPEKLYGKDAGSHYSSSGPSLSKHFKDREIAWS